MRASGGGDELDAVGLEPVALTLKNENDVSAQSDSRLYSELAA